MSTPAPTAPAAAATSNPRRKFLLRLVFVIVVLALLAWGAWYWLDGRWYAGTDDAYVHANIVAVTPLVPGTVTAIDADDNDFVRAGQTLVQFDAADARVALERAEANLAQTVRRVRVLYAGAGAAQALLATRQVELRRAEQDNARVLKLKGTGAISAQDVQHAADALAAARAALGAAREQLNSSRAPIAETVLARQPDVLAAAAMLRQAYLDLVRTRLLAPVSGYVAKRNVQLGQRVMPGTPLMAIVPLDHVWVDANFKETNIGDMRIGQPVTLTSDVYGGGVVYHGHVQGLGIGTGSAFALLPAQNATGNWIKIVQRLPVRIDLDQHELLKHPLRVGLSMTVEVNLHNQSGAMLATQPRSRPALRTLVYDGQLRAADALIARIIHANAGPASALPATHATQR
jgi:membrane fusion protein (multidrug efflux system)